MTINVPGVDPGTDTDAPISQGNTTVAELLERINAKIGNYSRQTFATFRGNFLQSSFVLPHRNVSNVQALINGARTEYFTAVAATGVVTFSTIPPGVTPEEPDNVIIGYEYTPWAEADTIEAINSAVNELWGKFYWEGVNDAVPTTGNPEYKVTDASGAYISPQARITRVDWASSSGPSAEWVRFETWHVRSETNRKIVVLETPIISGYYLRISFQCPGGLVDQTTDTLESTIGLPTRAKDAVVTMACANLLEAGVGKRFDALTRTETQADANQPKSYEVIQDINVLRASAYAKAQRVMMQPFSARIIT